MHNVNLVILVYIILSLIGILIPAIPSLILVLAGFFYYAYTINFTLISMQTIIFFSLLIIITIFLDYITILLFERRFDLSKIGIFLLVVGGVVGYILFNITGLVVAQVIAMISGELIEWNKRAINTLENKFFIIYLLNVMIKSSIVLIMVITFAYKVLL
ncbi:DUF456 domain-containing protein [Serpentinicella sp. ANB-PHB4]|uniref:DUF456 domain-containing protein n=1 Tax=Serpentinicella sp. ANB-PHB4 TaxID=3074076 RepID=UPI00285D5A91|nr:DUF456 domain-containing protein [Serpentinicella sp. ANB-PHB4]MDR5659002.1 DUF456 domain-containing protein [Serpentinicella sp. ANB-PHB4]